MVRRGDVDMETTDLKEEQTMRRTDDETDGTMERRASNVG